MEQKIVVKDTALIIPCHNEEKRLLINPMLKFIKEHIDSIDFYFVNDGSTDKTTEVLSENFSHLPNCSIIVLEKNKGKGNAVRKGIIEALKKDYRYYGFVDADLEIPLQQTLLLRNALKTNNCQLAISSRNLKSAVNPFNFRSLVSVAMVSIANQIIKMEPKISDTQCGCKLFTKQVAEICFREEFISKWLFDIEILLRMKQISKYREKISEVPLARINKSAEKSNFKFLGNMEIFKQLWTINRYYNK